MAEKKYIDIEAAIKRFNFAVLDCLGMEPTIRAGDIIKALESIPAADVRPVVLCRDCRYYRQSNFVDKHMECARSGFLVHPVDFCSLAEMREES